MDFRSFSWEFLLQNCVHYSMVFFWRAVRVNMRKSARQNAFFIATVDEHSEGIRLWLFLLVKSESTRSERLLFWIDRGRCFCAWYERSRANSVWKFFDLLEERQVRINSWNSSTDMFKGFVAWPFIFPDQIACCNDDRPGLALKGYYNWLLCSSEWARACLDFTWGRYLWSK